MDFFKLGYSQKPPTKMYPAGPIFRLQGIYVHVFKGRKKM